VSNDFGRFRTPDNQHEFDGIRLPDGSVRLLAATPPDPHKLRAAPTWRGAGMPTIPDKDLTDNPAWWQAPLVDQRSHGSCTGFSASIAIMHKRARDGYSPAVLSGSYIYSWVNGNRDGGAAISDAIEAAKVHGTCLDADCPWDTIYRRQYDDGKCDAQAALYRVDTYLRLEGPEDILSATELGWTCGAAVQVNNNFNNLDRDGVWGLGRGPGNHAVAVDGKYRHPSTRDWMFPNPMSWGPQAGMTGPPPAWLKQVEPNAPANLSGWGFFKLAHFDAVSYQEMYAIRSVAFGPDTDPGPPPPIA
jgi:hypothetical protein